MKRRLKKNTAFSVSGTRCLSINYTLGGKAIFTLLKTEGKARHGRFVTPHGTVETPVFMNVGTQAAIKGGLSSYDLKNIGCQIELSNTYHLHLRPGEEVIRRPGRTSPVYGLGRPNSDRQRWISGVFSRQTEGYRGGRGVV
jgi:hypothetical protein